MTNPLAQDLGGVVRLLEKATPGQWTVGRFGSVHRPKVEGSESSVGSAIVVGGSKSGMYDGYQENCEAIAAAVNFLRTNGPALLAMMEDHSPDAGKMGEDTARYRWLRDADNYPDHDWWANELGTTETGDQFDAAIDAARAGERG